jgi:hypothetical protein
MYEEGLRPNLHLSALGSQTDRSWQTTYEGKPQSRTENDRKIAQLDVRSSVC